MSAVEQSNKSEICFSTNEEQYQLQQVSKDLKNIKNYVWKYREVEIVMDEIYALIANKINGFIHYNANAVSQKLNTILETNIDLILEKYKIDSFLKSNVDYSQILHIRARKPIKPSSLTTLFKNLTQLMYEGLILTNEDLKIVAENCKNLNTLILDHNVNQWGITLSLDKDIDLAIINSMDNLKNLL